MKKVLLLGDSIRMGYDSYVKEILTECEVYYDDLDNGRFSAYTIWQFAQLNKQYGPFDIVHFNNGYWDVNNECPNGERETPIPDYVHNFERLIKQIRSTGATPIFATSLPLLDLDQLGDNPLKITYDDYDIQEYNKAALELMAKEKVAVNDLYSLIKKYPNYLKCDDKLHLVEEGYKICAKQVAEVIRKALKY